MKKLKIGIIGCGNISAAHVNAYQRLGDQVELVAFCDTDRARAEARAT
ncbi:MAG: Gfo/Idh/MocA family oxidoreductase, partial [Armatimonadota bacterium]|nr:Gfo/Idh/MocA family oxidoreductase [Armatimonadota bacterium]